jgi:hypothetical protein
MQLLLAREINGKKISKHVRFVAATNSRKDNAGVNGLITPLLSRFHLIVELEVDANDWKLWAVNNNMPMELISFVNFRPQLLEGKMIKMSKDSNGKDIVEFVDVPVTKEIENFACPRTIANLGKWINAKTEDLNVWEGCVGSSFAIEFAAFYQTYKKLAGLPEKIINNPMGTPIPQELSTLFALSGALVHKANNVNIDAIMQFIERIPEEFQMFFTKDLCVKSPDIYSNEAIAKWNIRHQDDTK